MDRPFVSQEGVSAQLTRVKRRPGASFPACAVTEVPGSLRDKRKGRGSLTQEEKESRGRRKQRNKNTDEGEGGGAVEVIEGEIKEMRNQNEKTRKVEGQREGRNKGQRTITRKWKNTKK